MLFFSILIYNIVLMYLVRLLIVFFFLVIILTNLLTYFIESLLLIQLYSYLLYTSSHLLYI